MSSAYQPSPVSVVFENVLGRIQLTSTDRSLFESHRASIRNNLASASSFELNRLEAIGSFSRGTAVTGMSDADLMAIVGRASVSSGDALQTSTTVLSKFRTSLSTRFWNTDVVRDGQAIVVDFGDGSHPVDVVPALWRSQHGFNNYPVYVVPDGRGWWMATSPTSHNRYIADADRRAGGKLTYAAQLVKYWCGTRATRVPLSGFHVELLLAMTGVCNGARSYGAIVRDVFTFLARRDGAALTDPLGIAGRIPAATSDAKREATMRSVADAADHADRALHAEQRGNTTEALRQWDIAFNGCLIGGGR